jgi:ADP-heptose:LPS heptosyltransferase
MKLFQKYDSPSTASRLVMAIGDLLLRAVVPVRPVPRLPLQKKQRHKLILLRLDGIGDNICSWPALQLLREQLPGSTISLAVGPWAAPLYRECPWVDEVISWDSGLFGLFRGKGIRGILTDFRIARQLGTQKFDIGIDLRGDLLSIILLRLIAPPIRTGLAMRGGGRLLTDPQHVSEGHESVRTHTVVKTALDMRTAVASGVTDWSRPLARNRALEKLQMTGWEMNRPTAALCPEALWQWKRWPREHFLELARRLESEAGLQTIWIAENVEHQEDLDGRLIFSGPLDEVAAVLSLCNLAVSSDSGLLHLAVAAGCATVQLFGPGDADRFAHTGKSLIVHHERSCGEYPCVQRGVCRRSGDGWCMEKIRVTDVFNSCRRLLAESGERINKTPQQEFEVVE